VDPAVTEILRNRTKRENLQQLLDRMSPEMVDVVELDFLFPPTIPLAAQLKGLLSTRTSYMSSVTPEKLVHTRLFHFPEVGCLRRVARPTPTCAAFSINWCSMAAVFYSILWFLLLSFIPSCSVLGSPSVNNNLPIATSPADVLTAS
jgi:hypothetical protein